MGSILIQHPEDQYDQEVITREAGAAIDQGAVLIYDTTGTGSKIVGRTVIENPVDGPLGVAMGVALEDAASGAQVRICKAGVCQALVEGTADVDPNDILIADDAVAGALMLDAAAAAADATQQPIALEAVTDAGPALALVKVNFG